MKRIRRSRQVKFTDRRQSVRGICSLSLSVISTLVLIFSIKSAYDNAGNGGPLIGGMGMASLFLTFIALFLAFAARKEEDVFRTLPRIALWCALILLLLWMAVYGLGIWVSL